MLSLVSRNGILSLGLHLQISESSSEAFLVCSIVNFNECEMRLISAKNLCKLSFEPKNMNRQSSRNLLYKRRGLTPFSPNFIAAILIFSSIKLIKISATFGAHFVFCADSCTYDLLVQLVIKHKYVVLEDQI